MTMTRANGAALLTPEQVAELLVQPIITESVAAQVATVVTTTASSFRVPAVQEDPSASWVAEGEEIPVSDAVLAEAVADFHKLAGLVIITNELAADSSPQAAAAIGEGLARDMARKLDEAWFGNLAAPAPKGLAGLAGVSTIAAGASITNTDPFVEAIAAADTVGAVLTSFVANPADALALEKMDLWGTHTGALVALEMASRHTALVRSLILLGAAAVMPVHPALLEAAQTNPAISAAMVEGE